MKKVVASVVLILMMAGLSYAAGPPVQPVPKVKGCWAGTSIVTQTGGSAPNGSPRSDGPPPFYWNAGKKMLNQLYLKVDFQFGTQIKGTYFIWLPLPGGSGDFFAFPFEGYVNGNLFQLYTSTEHSPYNDREQQRYLTGILTRDSGGKKVIYGMGIGSRDMPLDPYNPSVSWQNIVFTFTFKPYDGLCDSCDDFPDPTTDDTIGAPGCPWQGCPSPQPHP